MTSRFTIEPLIVPEAPGAAGWEDFEAANAVRNVCEAVAYGTDDLGYRADELLPMWRNTEFDPKHGLIARLDGAVVGRAVCDTLADPASTHAWLEVLVRPEARGIGIGSALSDAIEQFATDDGRSTFIVYAASPDASGPRLDAPTGFGSVPLENREVRFLLDRGYRLEQLNRGSRLALPADPEALRRLEADTVVHAASDYDALTWIGSTPPRYRADLARLHTRMSTDAPTAGLQEPEDVWTEARLDAEDASRESSDLVPLTAAVVHRGSGALVAFSTLLVPSEPTRAITQDDTLVLREHRGHRLGTLVKLANLRALERAFPGHPSIITFNAEENRPMLSVNEAMGFRPIGYEGAWRRDVAGV
ncbi:GNAT family N-acetyltransferase [Rathayibacter sp. YIM 133350]|uniref:GNAT family N-acetyltransferase n=1 Tax=Rathayibacter sp. YIM 133350 TaxID=3131992 RepID=UPI00307D001E